MKKILILVIVMIVLAWFIFCKSFTLKNKEDQNSNLENNNVLNKDEERDNNMNKEEIWKVNIIINDTTFTATLIDNETTREFMKLLPLNITMNELNGNEKYYYLDKSLPNHAAAVGKINTGDLMLYGSDCLVLFYDTFHTNYFYTRIGTLDEPNNLKTIVSNGNINISITK